jgi:predicted phosphodiesterase
MKFDLMSDLHIDLSPGYVLDYASMATAPIAIVAGDVSNTPSLTVKELNKISQHYEYVLFVDGNHEHYDNRDERLVRGNRMPPATCEYFRNALSGSNVIYLDQGTEPFVMGLTAFVGANGWYDFNWAHVKRDACISTWYAKMNDSYWANVDHEWVYNESVRHAANILKSVQQLNDNPEIDDVVLITHTIPTSHGVYNHPTNSTWNTLNGCYLNSMMAASHIDKVKAHCFGHTHRRQQFSVDSVEMICNPRGYQGEPSFNNWTPIQVDLDILGTSAFGEIEK